jgi:hypothetical protein
MALFSQSIKVTVPRTSITTSYPGQNPDDWLSLDFLSFQIGAQAGDQFVLVTSA